MHLHDFLILNIQSFVPLRWEEKILVKIAKCGWRKCLESKYVYAYTKTEKNGKFFCTIPNSPGSVLQQRNKSHCQARKLKCMSSANTEQCIFEKMHYLLQRNSLLGGEGTWQFLHLHNSLPWKLLCSLGSQWTSCDSQPAKHRKIHSVSPFWKCIDLVLCEWKGQRMRGGNRCSGTNTSTLQACPPAPGGYGFTTPASTCQPKNGMNLRFIIHLSYWGVWYRPVRTLYSTKRLSEAIISKSLSSI